MKKQGERMLVEKYLVSSIETKFRTVALLYAIGYAAPELVNQRQRCVFRCLLVLGKGPPNAHVRLFWVNYQPWDILQPHLVKTRHAEIHFYDLTLPSVIGSNRCSNHSFENVYITFYFYYFPITEVVDEMEECG
ncbi:hypothetical protein Godav_008302 [Gossypium davidsonii]|uniref:Uncharacterized protein n=1 Tax=Gossypium davidsonii TaxID=34287 RepID=A0A7J8S9P3_GOSDV|nr:hypothetical protein [Gossypium davidsonii]